jgi:hypothetical protein
LVLDLSEKSVLFFKKKYYIAPVIAYVAFIYLNPSTEQALALFKFPLSDLPSHQPHFLFLKKL